MADPVSPPRLVDRNLGPVVKQPEPDLRRGGIEGLADSLPAMVGYHSHPSRPLLGGDVACKDPGVASGPPFGALFGDPDFKHEIVLRMAGQGPESSRGPGSSLCYVMILYIGPDVVAPLASALAAIGGAILIFWRQVKSAASRVAGWFRRR